MANLCLKPLELMIHLEHHTMVEANTRKQIFLSQLYHRHTLVTGIMVMIGASFAILAFF